MAKKVLTLIKLQIPAGAANPAPPVGPALGQHGVNIMEFCKAFNAQTQQDAGTIIPVEITVYEDRSFDFITKTPPAAVLIKEALGIEKGSGEPHREKVGTISPAQVRQIAERKMPDLNANDLDAASKIIAGTARSMGVDVEGHGVGMAHGKRYRAAYEKVDRDRALPAGRGRRPDQGDGARQVRRDGRAAPAARRQRPPRRGAAARHPRAAPRPRQGRHGRRLRRGRRGPRRRGGRRRLRRRAGPGRARSRRAGPTSTSRSRPPT